MQEHIAYLVGEHKDMNLKHVIRPGAPVKYGLVELSNVRLGIHYTPKFDVLSILVSCIGQRYEI